VGGTDEAVAPPPVSEPVIAAPTVPSAEASAATTAELDESRSLPSSPADTSVAAVSADADTPAATITSRPPTAIAAAPAEGLPFDGLNATPLGDRLSQEIDATAIALGAVAIEPVPAVPAEAAINDLNLAPVTAAAQAIAASAPETVTPGVDTESEATSETQLFSPLPSPGEAIDIPVIPPPAEAIAKAEPPEVSDPALTRALPPTIETGASLPDLPAVATEPATTAATPRLAVPNTDIPRGTGGNLPEVFTTGAAAALPSEGPPPPPSLAASLGLNYKVLVVAPDSATQAQVRAQVPDAFRTQLNGQSYMQAGAYPSLAEAQAMLNQLRQVGLSAQIEEVR